MGRWSVHLLGGLWKVLAEPACTGCRGCYIIEHIIKKQNKKSFVFCSKNSSEVSVVSTDVSFECREHFLNRVEVGRVWRQIDETNTSAAYGCWQSRIKWSGAVQEDAPLSATDLYLVNVVNRTVVHNQDTFWGRIWVHLGQHTIKKLQECGPVEGTKNRGCPDETVDGNCR